MHWLFVVGNPTYLREASGDGRGLPVRVAISACIFHLVSADIILAFAGILQAPTMVVQVHCMRKLFHFHRDTRRAGHQINLNVSASVIAYPRKDARKSCDAISARKI